MVRISGPGTNESAGGRSVVFKWRLSVVFERGRVEAGMSCPAQRKVRNHKHNSNPGCQRESDSSSLDMRKHRRELCAALESRDEADANSG